MDDRLQRRLRDADPLAATDGQTPDVARLDAIKEQIMQTEARPGRSARRPRALGVTALMAGSLATVLVVGTLIRPASSALAWDPSPTAATAAQKAEATTACAAGLLVPTGAEGGPAIGVPAPDASGLPVIEGNTSVTVTGGTGVTGMTTVGGDGAAPPPIPALPAKLPPLVTLELHGTGGVAVFADAVTTAYCLLIQKDGELVLGGLLFPGGDGTVMGVGTIGTGASSGSVSVSGTTPTGRGGLQVSAMAMTFDGQTVGIVAGIAPDGATTVKVKGGAADGATATVERGRFALWSPKPLDDADVDVVAYDASGKEVARQTLTKAGMPPPPDAGRAPIVVETTAP